MECEGAPLPFVSSVFSFFGCLVSMTLGGCHRCNAHAPEKACCAPINDAEIEEHFAHTGGATDGTVCVPGVYAGSIVSVRVWALMGNRYVSGCGQFDTSVISFSVSCVDVYLLVY